MGSRTAAWAFRIAVAGAVCASACAGGADTAAAARFAAANDAYGRGAYAEAVSAYEELRAAGFSTAALHYNLGNALFKTGRLAPAIAAHERALRLSPRDPDIRANLDYLKSLTVDRLSPAPSPLTALGVAFVLDLTSPDQDAIVFLATWLLAGGAVAGALAAGRERARKAALYAAATFLVPALLSGASLAVKSYLESTRAYGVVLEPEANVLSGAGEENPTLFTVHEGLKVRLHARSADWVQVSLENGLTGWLPAAAIEVI